MTISGNEGVRDRIVELRRVRASELVPNPKNWRTHNTKQRKALRTMIGRLGFAGAELAVQLDDGRLMLIDGHLRAEEYPDAELPVLVTDLTLEEADALLATFDPISAMAGRDDEALSALMADVGGVFGDLMDIFESMDLVDVELEMREAAASQIDRAEELQGKWQVTRGDTWVIKSLNGGEHRLRCGDSTNEVDVESLLDGAKPRLMVTDPPYGVEYNQDWRSDNRVGKVANDDNASWFDTWRLSPADVAYVWHASKHAAVVATDLEMAGFEHRAQIIWNKPRHVFSQGHYHWKHEPCFYVVRKGSSAKWAGDRKQNTVWDIEADEDAPGNHGTQKPVECMARPLRNHEGNVYDPFGGSGTTMVAAEQWHRLCFMMELEEKYCASILERMQLMGCECRREGSDPE